MVVAHQFHEIAHDARVLFLDQPLELFAVLFEADEFRRENGRERGSAYGLKRREGRIHGAQNLPFHLQPQVLFFHGQPIHLLVEPIRFRMAVKRDKNGTTVYERCGSNAIV